MGCCLCQVRLAERGSYSGDPSGFCPYTLGENPVFVEDIYEELPSPSPSGYPDFVKNEAAFRVHRDVLIRFADMLYAEGIKYDYQSDWNFLLAAIMYDKSIVIL
jgi:hypothetical protein